MKKSNMNLYITAVVAVVILIGVGYATLMTTLNIKGQTIIEKPTWGIYFENIKTDSNDVKFYAVNDTSLSNPIEADQLDKTTNTIKYSIDLQMDGRYHTVMFDIANKGTIDAKIYSVPGWFNIYGDITSAQKVDTEAYNPIFYALTTGRCNYNDGGAIKKGDIIEAGTSRSVICSHHMKTGNELNNSDLQVWNNTNWSTYSTLTGSFNLDITFTEA